MKKNNNKNADEQWKEILDKIRKLEELKIQ